jgi:hypothetical protein
MCPSSCVKARTRMMPCRAPGLRCGGETEFTVAQRLAIAPEIELKIWTWPGQFIGLIAKSRFSDSVVNMCSL